MYFHVIFVAFKDEQQKGAVDTVGGGEQDTFGVAVAQELRRVREEALGARS